MCTTCNTFEKTISLLEIDKTEKQCKKLMQQLLTYIDREARVSQQKMDTGQIISLAFLSNKF